MKTKRLSESDEQKEVDRAERLDRWISARFSGRRTARSSDSMDEADVAWVEQLVEVSQTIQPDPTFVHEVAVHWSQNTLETPTRRLWFFPTQRSPFFTRRLVPAAVLALLLLLSGVLLTPQTRAALLDVIYGMRLMEKEEIAELEVPLLTPKISNGAPGTMTLDEIFSQAPFPVRLPTWLPEGLTFTGGFVDHMPENSYVSLVYHRRGAQVAAGQITGAVPYLFLAIATGPNDPMPILESDHAQAVTINGHPGLYSHGGWRAGKQVGDQLTGVRWDQTVDSEWLSWQQENLTYLLQADGLTLGRDGIIKIAESLQEVSWPHLLESNIYTVTK